MSMAGRYEYSTGKFGSSPLSLLDYEVSAMLQLIPQLHGICRVFFLCSSGCVTSCRTLLAEDYPAESLMTHGIPQPH